MLESPFSRVAGLKVCIFIKKETPTQLFSCEYCQILKNGFFIERLTTSGQNWCFSYSLCHCFVFLHNSITISLSWLFRTCFYTKIVILVKCNFRTHYHVGSSSILIEWLMFRNNPSITVTSPSNLLWKLWIWVFWILRLLLFFLRRVLQGVAKNNPTKKELNAQIQATLKHMPAC